MNVAADDRSGQNGIRRGIYYIGLCMRDIMRFTPLMLWGKLAVSIVEGVMGVWQPVLIAEICGLASKLNTADAGAFGKNIALLCLCVGLPSVSSIVMRATAVYNDSKKESCYGWSLFEHAQKIRLEALEDAGVLDVLQKADASYSDQMAGSKLLSCMLMIVEAVLVCISTIFVAGSFSVWLVPGAVLGFIPHLAVKLCSERRRAEVYRAQSGIRRRMQYLWMQFCRKESVKEMRTMGFGNYFKKLWVEANVAAVQQMKEVELKALRLGSLDDMIKNTCYAANIAVAVFLMVRGDLEAGQFAACLSAFALLQNELMKLGNKIGEAAVYYHYVEEYYDFFRIETEREGGEEYRPFQKTIEMRDVHFRYPGCGQDVLNGVNLEIRKGEHVVIVGVNGSGKTTLSKVLTGAFEADSGEVCYDGQDVKRLKKSSLYRDISLVPQNFVQYHFTLRENICISDLKYRGDEKRLQSTIEAAKMQELVQSIGGPDSQLGREFGGRELSGGEWQKVAIARGLFKDSELIILDEPTSALDPLVEYDILTGFLGLIRNKTSVIISHRVGICRLADKIVVMKDGRVAECGTHEELKEAGGEYSRIWEEQAKWY